MAQSGSISSLPPTVSVNSSDLLAIDQAKTLPPFGFTTRKATVGQILAAPTTPAPPLNILDFGGVADGITDNTAALNAAIAFGSFNLNLFNAGFGTGPRIYFPGAGHPYFFASTIQLKVTVILEGDSGVGSSNGDINTAMASVLQFPVNTGGIIVQTYNTINFTTQSPTTTGADGSIIRNLGLICGSGTFNQVGNPIDITGQKSGIYCRAQTIIRDVTISGFPGDGIHIEATIGAGGAGEGSASGCLIDNVVINKCQRFGFFQSGGDVNAGLYSRINVHSGGCAGIVDRCFLSSTHIAPQMDGTIALSANTFGYVTFGGNVYQLINSDTGIGASTTPGTNDLVWYLLGTTAALPGVGLPWSNANTYLVCCAIQTQGNNHAISIINPYIEGGVPLGHVSGGTTVWPIPTNNPFTRYSQQIGNFDGIGLGIGAYSTGIGAVHDYLSGGSIKQISSFLGETGVNPTAAPSTGGFFGTWTAYRDTLNWPQTLRWASNIAAYAGGTQNTTDLYLEYGVGFSPIMQYISGPNTARQFGTGAAVPYMVSFPIIGLGEELFGAPARRITIGTAVPSSGAWAVGDTVINSAPTANGIDHWRCVTAGTPGTWKSVTIVQAPGTLTSLGSASTAGAGARGFITDSTVAGSGNFGAVAAGSSTHSVPVYSDGTNWLIG
jgi:hypothetical protein